MTQAGFFHFAPAQTPEAGLRLLGASLALTRHASGQWAKLVEAQFAFTRDLFEATLEELARAGKEDPRSALLNLQMAVGRRLVELGLRHLQRTGELMLEGQREWLAHLARSAGETAARPATQAVAEKAAAATVVAKDTAGSEAAAGESGGGEEPAAEERRRAQRREASAA